MLEHILIKEEFGVLCEVLFILELDFNLFLVGFKLHELKHLANAPQ